MRILWTHNFDKADSPVSGVFMDVAARAVREAGLDPTLLFLEDLRSPVGLARARKAVKRSAPDFDIVHAQYGSATALASVGCGTPTIVSLRGSDWTAMHADDLRGKLHGRLAVAMTRAAIRRAAGAIPVSHRIEHEVSSLRADLPMCVLPDPVDFRQFHPRDKSHARATLGLDQSAKYVLFTTVSRTNPIKRPELARAAVAIAAADIPGLELLVATGRSHEQMPLFAAAADVALSTSVAEGWPNCIKEALACDVPFVATDVSDLRDIAAVDERCQIVEARPEAIADALVRCLREGTPGTGLNAHVRDMAPAIFASRLLGFYSQILGSAP